MDGDRLVALRDALLFERAELDPASGMMRFTVSHAMREGAADLEERLPEWVEDGDARAVYSLAFEAAWLAVRRHVEIVLGFPEARGQEREAIRLALDPALAFDEIAARLRAPPAAVETSSASVIPFPAGRRRSSAAPSGRV